MLMILGLLSALIGIVNLAAFIIVVIQLFKAKGVGHGIAGICCGLYTLVWGWQNADNLDANNPPVLLKYKQWMLLWTIAVGAQVALNVVLQVSARH